MASGENALASELTRLEGLPSWEMKPMEVGDVGIMDPDSGHFSILIERKTQSDLFSSFAQGRYSDQRDRLCLYREATGCKVGYIIEGYPRGDHVKEIRGCIYNLQVHRNIFVLQTANTRETAEAIRQLYRSTLKKHTSSESCPQPVQALKLKRADRLGEADWLTHALTIIPTMSLERARAITKVHPDIESLVKASQSPNGLAEMAELRVGTSQKRLGKALVEKVRTHLLYTPAPEKQGADEEPAAKKCKLTTDE